MNVDQREKQPNRVSEPHCWWATMKTNDLSVGWSMFTKQACNMIRSTLDLILLKILQRYAGRHVGESLIWCSNHRRLDGGWTLRRTQKQIVGGLALTCSLGIILFPWKCAFGRQQKCALLPLLIRMMTLLLHFVCDLKETHHRAWNTVRLYLPN